jgi:hypothetical protein
MMLDSTVTASSLSLLLVALATSGAGCLGAGAPHEEVDVGHDEAAVCAGSPEWREGQWYHVDTVVNYPTLRGAFDWQIHTDEGLGWPFANRVGPLVRQ